MSENKRDQLNLIELENCVIKIGNKIVRKQINDIFKKVIEIQQDCSCVEYISENTINKAEALGKSLQDNINTVDEFLDHIQIPTEGEDFGVYLGGI